MKLQLLISLLACVLTVNVIFAADDITSMEPGYKETDAIGLDDGIEFKNLVSFCIDRNDNILACDGEAGIIKVISPEGKALADWKIPFNPYTAHACPDGSVYIAGDGTVALADENGKIVKQVKSADLDFSSGRPSGITANKNDVFVAFGAGWSLRSLSRVFRFNRELTESKMIARDLRGCCQRLDLVASEDVLFVAENSRYRVVKYDRNGKLLGVWGSKARSGIEGFGSCCNPMNLFLDTEGTLYTSESGLGRIKTYDFDGNLKSLIGHVGVDRFNRAGRLAASCSNISVAINKKKTKVYVLDFKNNLVRVLEKK